ncbi:MAG: hypothetical protein ACRCXM_10575 [Beijerinckiaceae bacterium]
MTGINASRRKILSLCAAGMAALFLAAGPAYAEDKPHRLALQVSDADPDKMMAALDVARNVSELYSEKAEEVDIQIIAMIGGLAMLRADTSPVKERVLGFAKSMPNVTFVACGNTIDTLKRREGRDIPLLPNATIAKAGVVRLMELQEAGWTIVRP